MTDCAATQRARAMAETIDAMLEFAEREQDYVLAAKLADVHAHLTHRFQPLNAA